MEHVALIGIGNVTQRYVDAFESLGVQVSAFHRTEISKARFADGVCILTEPQSHYDLMQHFKDKPLLIEKPIACDYKTAKLMQKECPQIYPGFQLRYNKQIQKLKEQNTASEGHAVINVPRGDHYYRREWRKQLSPMAHIGIHAVDFFIWWFGSVDSSYVENESIVMLHSGGAKSSVKVSQTPPNLFKLKVGKMTINNLANHYDMCYDFINQSAKTFDASESIYQIEVNNLW